MVEQVTMADQVFVPELGLDQALRTVAREGFAFVPRTLAEDFRRGLQQEVQACPFQPVPGEIGPVRQETEECVIPTSMDRYPLVARLSGEIVALVRDHGRAVAGLEAWVPTAAFVQRYRPGALGITPHLGRQAVRVAGCGVHHEGVGAVLSPPDPAGAGGGSMGGGSRKPGVAPGPGAGRRGRWAALPCRRPL